MDGSWPAVGYDGPWVRSGRGAAVGLILEGHELSRPVTGRTHTAVIGSGAGGAVVAALLAEAGVGHGRHRRGRLLPGQGLQPAPRRHVSGAVPRRRHPAQRGRHDQRPAGQLLRRLHGHQRVRLRAGPAGGLCALAAAARHPRDQRGNARRVAGPRVRIAERQPDPRRRRQPEQRLAGARRRKARSQHAALRPQPRGLPQQRLLHDRLQLRRGSRAPTSPTSHAPSPPALLYIQTYGSSGSSACLSGAFASTAPSSSVVRASRAWSSSSRRSAS